MFAFKIHLFHISLVADGMLRFVMSHLFCSILTVLRSGHMVRLASTKVIAWYEICFKVMEKPGKWRYFTSEHPGNFRNLFEAVFRAISLRASLVHMTAVFHSLGTRGVLPIGARSRDRL